MENNNHIDQIFKGALKNFESRPDNDIWDRIESKLNQTEAPVSRINYTRYAVVAFLFLTLCLITVPLSRKPVFNNSVAFEIPAQNTVSNIISSDPIPDNTIFQASTTEIHEPSIASAQTDQKSPETLIQSVALAEFPEIINADFIFVEEVEPAKNNIGSEYENPERIYNNDIPVNAFGANKLPENNDFAVEDRDIDESKFKINVKGMYIGAAASYNQTSIIEYGSIFRGERPIQPSLKFGTSKGLTVGYNFSNKFGIQADYIYNSVQGQNYVTSEDEIVTEKTLALYYDQVSLSAKFKQARMSDLTGHPIVMNYIAGLQYGMLRQYRLPQEKRWETEEELFKNYEYAIVLGLDYDVYLQKNLFLSLGARGSLSTDISAHEAPLDDYAKRNFVFGVRGGINYVFR